MRGGGTWGSPRGPEEPQRPICVRHLGCVAAAVSPQTCAPAGLSVAHVRQTRGLASRQPSLHGGPRTEPLSTRAPRDVDLAAT